MKTLVTARFPELFRAELSGLGCDAVYTGRSVIGRILTKEEIIEHLHDVEVYISDVEQVTAEIMDAAPKLRVIACCRNEAFASVDIEAATARNIPVLSATGRNAVSVAEFTIGLLLTLCKNIAQTDYHMRRTQSLCVEAVEEKVTAALDKPPSLWSTGPNGPAVLYGGFPELYGKAFGQIGYGSIGREVAKRAAAFDMDILIYDPYLKQEDISLPRARLVELKELMQESDFISINCNVTPSTTQMLNMEVLSLMKPTSYIVNTARAPIMDYDALYELLSQKKIAGAALDVYPVEPVQKGYKFLNLENVVLTPHLAGQSRDVPFHQNRVILDSLKAFLGGERPRTICNPSVL